MPQPTHPVGKHDPCKRCLKTVRYDYNGYCMDCADELGLSELYDPQFKNNPLAIAVKKSLKKYPTVKDLPTYGKSMTQKQIQKLKDAGAKFTVVDEDGNQSKQNG